MFNEAWPVGAATFEVVNTGAGGRSFDVHDPAGGRMVVVRAAEWEWLKLAVLRRLWRAMDRLEERCRTLLNA